MAWFTKKPIVKNDFRKPTFTSNQPLTSVAPVPLNTSATTPVYPPGGALNRATLKNALKFREDNNLSAGEEMGGLGGNFWESLSATAKKVTNISKEVKKASEAIKTVGGLIKKKPSKGVTVTTAGPSVVTKPLAANDETPPGGIPLGSGIPEPQVPTMTATDSVTVSKTLAAKAYLVPAAIGIAALGLFYALTRKK